MIESRCIRPGLKMVLCFLVFVFYASMINNFVPKSGRRSFDLDKRKWWEDMFCNKENDSFTFPKDRRNFKHFLVDVSPEKSSEMKNIFIVESDCKSKLPIRFLCAAESAARHNPNSTVWFLTLTPSVEDEGAVLGTLLTEMPNIVPCVTDLNRLFEETPLQVFNSSDKWTVIKDYQPAHVSDAIRLSLVWHFGGTYLDADIISVKALPEEPNVLVMDVPDLLINGFIRAKRRHPFIWKLMKYVAQFYNGESWGDSGPVAITKLMKKFCQVKKFKAGKCKDFTILNRSQYQPVSWPYIKHIYMENTKTDINELLENSYGIHLSNHIYGDLPIESKSVFDRISKRHCPIVHKEMTRRAVT